MSVRNWLCKSAYWMTLTQWHLHFPQRCHGKQWHSSVAGQLRYAGIETLFHGQKSWVGRRSSYFLIFSNAAASAAAPATNDVLAKWEFANVSEIVTSHVMHLPLPHGIKVIPSGRLLSLFNNPAGSFLHGILAFKSVRQIISLMASWRAMWHVLRRHAGPWLPLSSTRAPQMHVYGSQRPTPSRRPTATRMASLSKRRPQAVIGQAFSQSPLCGAWQASRRALL